MGEVFQGKGVSNRKQRTVRIEWVEDPSGLQAFGVSTNEEQMMILLYYHHRHKDSCEAERK